MYLELTGLERLPHPRTKALAACKRAVAHGLRECVGTVLRRSDVVAAGAGAQFFVALLVGRALPAPTRRGADDAELGVVSNRVQAAVRTKLHALASSGDSISDIGVIGGWTVLDPVSEERPLAELRQAIRGAAVVARVEAQRAVVLAAVTHELRTPLTSIIGYAEALRDDPDLAPEQRARYGAIVASEGQRLRRLVEGLIDIGAWSAGKLKLDYSRVQLADVVTRAWAAVAARAVQKAIRFQVAGHAEALVDADRLEQVVINLLDNAIRHSPASGSIVVRIVRTAQGVTIAVTDSGAGFSLRAAKHVGTPFAPGADGRAGLGLSIARLLVEAHGGAFVVRRGSGGARVQISLPAPRAT